jgi:hypothetical protein
MRGVVMHGPGDVRVEERELRGLSSQRTRSSASPRPASADHTFGLTGVSGRRTARLRWVMSTVISNGSRFVLIGGDAGAGITTIIEALLPTSSDHRPTARPS